MITGQCLCGTVTWQISGRLTEPSHCHCSICRKSHGAAFASYTSCPEEAFEWTGGADAICRFRTSPDIERAFCGTCGSVVPDGDGSERFIPLGGLSGDPGLSGGRHIFMASKAPWHIVADTLPAHDFWPGGDDGPVVDDPPPDAAPPAGVVRGSCQCGAAAFEVDLPFRVIHNCHCSRCRQARAATHATNGFVLLDAFRWTRGADAIATYRLPAAKMFGQAFCTTCGSGMPRANTESGIVSVPLGSLDDDPGQNADDHIFVGSKAPWWDLADDGLPRFDEMPG